jgi:2-oxoglutarate ferredoxin oxidoreductase subunit delta
LNGTIQIDRERCKGCTLCIEFCPKESISLSEELNLKGYFVAAFDAATGCTGCGNCALMCPEVAIEVVRA